jgi:hypothetical protein
MQDHQIGPKIVGSDPADMARLPPSTITNKYFRNKQPCLPAGTTPTLNLPCFTYKENCLFLLAHYLSSS